MKKTVSAVLVSLLALATLRVVIVDVHGRPPASVSAPAMAVESSYSTGIPF